MTFGFDEWKEFNWIFCNSSCPVLDEYIVARPLFKWIESKRLPIFALSRATSFTVDRIVSCIPPQKKKLDKTNASHCVILGINDEISNGVFTLVRVYLSLMAVCLRREEWAKGFMSTRANGVYVSAAVQWLAGLPVNGPSCKPSPPLKRQRA